MTTVMNDLEKVSLTVAEYNALEKPVAIGGVPVWVSSDEGVVTVLAAPDGLSAVASSVGTGSATVTVTADGMNAVEYFSITPSPGVKLVITASAPEPK